MLPLNRMTSGSDVKSTAALSPARLAASAAARPVAPAFSTFLRETLLGDLVFMMISLPSGSPVEPVGLAPIAVPVLFLLVVEVVPDHRTVHHGELGVDVLDLLVGHRHRIEVVRGEHGEVGL